MILKSKKNKLILIKYWNGKRETKKRKEKKHFHVHNKIIVHMKYVLH